MPDNKPENLKPDNFLSDEEQKNFDKYMNDYESQNDRATEIYNDDSNIAKVAKNKNTIIAAIGLCFILCGAGVINSFMNISDTGATKKDVEVAEQKKAQTAAENQANQDKLSQKQAEDKQREDEAKAQTQNKKELDEIKNNYHPWDGDNSNMMNQPQQSMSAQNNADNNQAYNSSNNSMPQQYQQQQTQVQPQSQQPSYSSRRSSTMNNTDTPSTSTTTMNSDGTMQPNDSEWMALKGIAVDRNGNSVCYIKNGTSTNAYHEGDSVGDYIVSSINSSSVIVSDSDGNTMTINK